MKLIKFLALGVLAFLYACATPDATKQTTNVALVEEKDGTSKTRNVDFNQVAVVYFDFDKSSINSQEKLKVVDQALVIKQSNVSVVVEGHTDYLGTSEYNLALGERRANSTKSLLVKQGVDTNKIKVVSYGKDKPVDSALSDEARSKNRRTQTNINK